MYDMKVQETTCSPRDESVVSVTSDICSVKKAQGTGGTLIAWVTLLDTERDHSHILTIPLMYIIFLKIGGVM